MFCIILIELLLFGMKLIDHDTIETVCTEDKTEHFYLRREIDVITSRGEMSPIE